MSNTDGTKIVGKHRNGADLYEVMLPDSQLRVRFAFPGILGQRRVHAVLPILDKKRMKQLAADADRLDQVPDAMIDGFIRVTCVMTVDPKFSDAEDTPRGARSLDELSETDCSVLMNSCTTVFFKLDATEDAVTDPLASTTSSESTSLHALTADDRTNTSATS